MAGQPLTFLGVPSDGSQCPRRVRAREEGAERRNDAEEAGAGRAEAVKQRETSGAPHPRPDPLSCSQVAVVGMRASTRSRPQSGREARWGSG